MTDGNRLTIVDHFLRYINTESLCCTPKTSIFVCQLFFSVKKKKYHTKYS